MASLYIKDEETAALATEVARRLGTTKTEAVRRGLRMVEQGLPPPRAKVDLVAWVRNYLADDPVVSTTTSEDDRRYIDWVSSDADVIVPAKS